MWVVLLLFFSPTLWIYRPAASEVFNEKSYGHSCMLWLASLAAFKILFVFVFWNFEYDTLVSIFLSVCGHVCHQSWEVFSHSSITSLPIPLSLRLLRLQQWIFWSLRFCLLFFSLFVLILFSHCSNSLLKSSGVFFISVIVLLRYRISFWFLFVLSICWNFHFVWLLFSCFCPYIPLVLLISWRQLF